ncbi:MAG: hypothetical protein GY847_01870 [Proteobacteria bacterium]|nr:hypothetical protein [Pseudomonadota bacterium]
MRGICIVAVLTIIGCESLDPRTPEGAFAKLAPCVDRADRQCLYNMLGRDSRWSIQTIHRTLVEIRSLVDRSYPAHLKNSAYGIWLEEAHTADPAEMFDAYCKKQHCLKKVARGFGASVNVIRQGPDIVVIETTRGQRFEMFWAENRWGLTLFRDDLQKAKIRILDRKKQVKRNAIEHDNQKLAGSALEVNSETTEEKKHER